MDSLIVRIGEWFINQGPEGVSILILLGGIVFLERRNNALVNQLVNVIQTNSAAMARLSTLIEGKSK